MSISTTNQGILDLANNIHDVAILEPAAYGLTTARLEQYQTTIQRYAAALAAVLAPETRTHVAVVEKDAAKATLLRSTRSIVNVCENFPEMTDAKRAKLGITVRKPRTKTEPPKGKPVITIEAINGREVLVQLGQTKSRRDRPAGVDGANLFVFYGEQAPANPAEWSFLTGTSKTRLSVNLDGDPTAGTVWLTAMWFNRRKQTGLACAPVQVKLAVEDAVPAPSMKIRRAA